MNCQKCGVAAAECKGWLERVNPKGVPGIWECRPACGETGTIIDAIAHVEKIARRTLEGK